MHNLRTPTILFQTSHITIQYDPERKWLIQVWNDFIPSNEFREAIDATVMLVKSKEVTAIISDTLNQKAIKPEDSEYAASVVPLLFNAGLKAMAFVIPENIFTKISLKRFAIIGGENQHNVEYFFNRDDADNWLNSVASIKS